MTGPLSIIHVVRSPIGGIFRHIADLATAQRDAGHEVGVICDSLTGGAFEDEWIAALKPALSLGLVRLPMRRTISPADLFATVSVARLVARMRPNVVHGHGSKGGVYARLAAMLERRRSSRDVAAFYSPHGGSLHYEKGSLAGRVFFAVERSLELLTDALIHVSAYEARAYEEKVGMPRCPAFVVPNGLRPEEFEPVRPAENPADFLYIGMLRDLKGVDVFLRALRQLQTGETPFAALVVGAGEADDERRYREMATGLPVKFLPPMPARKAFAMARILVVPSRAESMPYIVLEAAAARMPIIATNVGGIPEILAGEAKSLLPPGDADALADGLAKALQRPKDMIAAATLRRDAVKQHFSLSRMAARIEDIYRGALETDRERPVEPAVRSGFPH
jgi:glycosyltransferase involved in cell wall biosynthesis